MAPLVWVITGTGSGLGRQLTLAALKRGDKVIATGRARSLAKLDDLKVQGAHTLELDVTAPLETLHEKAKKAVEIYGRVDVLVNNAGYMLVGAIEENTSEETLEQFNTNVFGALNVSRAFLPYMREKKTGTIVFIGSVGGWTAVPYVGLYVTTKFALRGISKTLHEEIASLGLRSTCIDFGYFRTSFLATDQRAPEVARIADYSTLQKKSEASLQAYHGKQPGDPVKGVEVICDVVRGEGVAQGKPFPTTLLLGTDCYKLVTEELSKEREGMEVWKEVSFSTDFA